MDKRYWDKFYKQGRISEPSSFVLFCVQWLKQHEIYNINKIYDLGCGNGRDTIYWGEKQKYKVTGIDQSVVDWRGDRWSIENSSLSNFMKKTVTKSEDIVYSRFFLHVLGRGEIRKVIRWTQGYFMAEFRLKGDKPILYTNHKRKLVDEEWLLRELVSEGYSILHYNRGKGLAPYRTEDPLVGRVIARR